MIWHMYIRYFWLCRSCLHWKPHALQLSAQHMPLRRTPWLSQQSRYCTAVHCMLRQIDMHAESSHVHGPVCSEQVKCVCHVALQRVFACPTFHPVSIPQSAAACDLSLNMKLLLSQLTGSFSQNWQSQPFSCHSTACLIRAGKGRCSCHGCWLLWNFINFSCCWVGTCCWYNYAHRHWRCSHHSHWRAC